MRIDYSEPKKAYVTPQGTSRPRKESTGYFTIVLVVIGIITFVAGFGTGWFMSQKSAKKSFQAATEQNSLESSPVKEPTLIPKPAQPALPAATTQSQPGSTTTQQAPAPPGGVTGEPPLSFYKTLPSGQKDNVLGSGINAKEGRTKQPLQAPIPANLNRSYSSDPAKQPADKSSSADKAGSKHYDNNTFTVQVASYPLKSDAEIQKNRLAGRGYNVFVVESKQGDKGTWYRVRVGKKLEQEAARQLAGKLGRTALVIPDQD